VGRSFHFYYNTALNGFPCAAHLAIPMAAWSATIIVNSASDIIADDGACTLREAIVAANTKAASSASA